MREYFEIFFPAGHNKEVLLVDDEPVNIALMRLCMKDLGFGNMLTAGNGDEALEIYSGRRDEIILVISDLQMPKMKGDQLFWELKELCENVRFLLCTGMVNGFDPKKLFQAGLKGFLHKPFTVDQFWMAVASSFF